MKKKLRSMLRIVFGRTAFMILFVILQLAFFLELFIGSARSTP